MRTLADAQPVTNKLSGICADAMRLVAADQIGIINLATGKVTIVPSGTNIAAVTGAAGLAHSVTLSQADPSITSSEVNVVNIAGNAVSDEITDIFTVAIVPKFSVLGEIDKLEDIAADPTKQLAVNGQSAIVVLNQADETIKVYAGDTANVEAVDGAALLAESAEFVGAVAAAGARQYGE